MADEFELASCSKETLKFIMSRRMSDVSSRSNQVEKPQAPASNCCYQSVLELRSLGWCSWEVADISFDCLSMRCLLCSYMLGSSFVAELAASDAGEMRNSRLSGGAIVAALSVVL